MRALVTGQIGLDKKQFLDQVAKIAKHNGEDLQIYHIGDMMYREAPDVRPGRILDLPLARLNSLRRAVFRDVIADMHNHKNVIVNTHATFRWKHGLFSAFDFDQLAAFDADLYVPSSTTSKPSTSECSATTISSTTSKTSWSGAKKKSSPPKSSPAPSAAIVVSGQWPVVRAPPH